MTEWLWWAILAKHSNRLEMATLLPSGDTTLNRTWFLSWTSLGSNILHTGCPWAHCGRLWTLPTLRQVGWRHTTIYHIKYPPHWVPLSALPTLRQVVLQRNCVKQTGGWPFCSDWMFKCSKCTKSGQLLRNFMSYSTNKAVRSMWGGRDLTHFGSQFVHVLVNWLTCAC